MKPTPMISRRNALLLALTALSLSAFRSDRKPPAQRKQDRPQFTDEDSAKRCRCVGGCERSPRARAEP